MIICAQLFANPRSSSLNSKFEICFLSLLAARGKKKLMKLSGSEFIRGGGEPTVLLSGNGKVFVFD
jgi:hypothetical protein